MISKREYPTLKHLLHKLGVNNPKMTIEEFTSEVFGTDRLSSQVKQTYSKFNPTEDKAHFKENDLPRIIQVLNSHVSEDQQDTMGGCAIVHYLASFAGMVATRVNRHETELVSQGQANSSTPKDKLTVLTDCMKALIGYMNLMVDIFDSGDFNSGELQSRIHADSYKIRSAMLGLERVISSEFNSL